MNILFKLSSSRIEGSNKKYLYIKEEEKSILNFCTTIHMQRGYILLFLFLEQSIKHFIDTLSVNANWLRALESTIEQNFE